jgi:hypothetical protein
MSATLTVVETHSSDLYAILQNPSEITKREMERAEVTSWKLLKSLNELLRISNADTLHLNGEPAIVFGHNPVAASFNRRVTWFVASEQYFALGARGVVFARNYLRRLHAVWPGTSFESYSYSDHPDLKRWFEALGFKYGYSTPNGCSKFTFEAAVPVKAKKDDLARNS